MREKSKHTEKKSFFVDESGDTTFFNKIGDCILGQEGCSPILIVGFVLTSNPHSIRKSLIRLHGQIKQDEYLKDIPSIKKTNIAFHAKDDCQEVREKVFKLLRTMDFKAEFVVARKRLDIFAKRHHNSEDVFYNEIVSRLFERKLHQENNDIYFSKRGNKIKQRHFENSIRSASLNFESKYGVKAETNTKVFVQTPSDEPCLQIIDYMNWAIQRAFVRSEMRYYNFINEKVSFLCDIYDFDKYPKNFYSRNNSFDVKKTSPLKLGSFDRTA